MRYHLLFLLLTGFFVLFTELLNTAGEHPFFFPGAVGALEVVLTVPEQVDKRYVAILGHPHSLQGGTMNNKVVTTLVRAFKELHIPSIRFNFRGVGQSAGSYDEGIGESDDMRLLASQWLQELPEAQLFFAGFSFGSYVAYRAAASCQQARLITIAPPVHHFDYTAFHPHPTPWVVLQGDDDEVVPLAAVHEFIEKTSPPIPLLRFAETGHFFHGKLIELKARLIEVIRQEVTSL